MAKVKYEGSVFIDGEQCTFEFTPIYCGECRGSVTGFNSTIRRTIGGTMCTEVQRHTGPLFVCLWEAIQSTCAKSSVWNG